MKHTKRAVSCGIVAVAMAVMFAGASLSGNVTDTSQSSQQANTDVVVLADVQNTAPEKESKTITQVNSENDSLATPVETADQAWVGKAMANVESSLNVRAAASADADVVGKLYKGSLAEVVEEGTEWTKIKSGNVEGYVNNTYCVFGDDAKALAAEVCKTYVTSETATVNVRSAADANVDDNIIHVLEEGEKIEVDTAAAPVDGWVVVKHDGKTGYVSAEFVTEPAYEYTKALTIEEEQAIEKAAAEAKAAKAKASKKSSSSSSKSSGSSSASSSASYSDVQLLAALIWCEARGESYEGQLAVGAVVMNRVESGSYPNSISGVIYQSGQFSPVSSGKLARALANGNYCMDAAQAALAGQDNTGGALHFNSGTGKGIQIGNQHFW